MSNGLKSLAQELPKYGRMGDTMVAHINPQEAALLKYLGGSGTINPTTGLPEFGFLGIGGGGGILGTGINKNASDPVSNALSNNPISKGVSNLVQSGAGAIDKALVSVDKTVGKVIPGGWGTVGMVAASMIPGMTPMMMGGLGALNGSGVLRKGGSFNLQGAMMGGAMAYGMSSLAQYAQGAATPSGAEGATPPATLPVSEVPVSGDAISSLNASQGWTGAGAQAPSAIPQSAINAANVANPALLRSTDVAALNALGAPIEAGAGAGLQVAPPPSIGSQIMSGNFGDAMSQIGDKVTSGFDSVGTGIKEGVSNAGTKIANTYDTLTNPDTYTTAAKSYGENVAKTGEGIKNLITGAEGASANAAANATKLGITSPMMATGATLYGGMGLMALDEQKKYLEQQKAANAISQAEYDSALAEINRSEQIARQSVAGSPFSTNPNRDVSIGETYYDRSKADENLYDKLTGSKTLYAAGGSVNTPDDQTGMTSQTPMQKLDQGYALGGDVSPYTAASMAPTIQQKMQLDPTYQTYFDKPNPIGNITTGGTGGFLPNIGAGAPMPRFAAGGITSGRFLSGGGDGMSDSIPATIGGKQEARLADGEFVIPADVVSHLGNGSSKAGAKQLYSMMDKVRTARTGTKKQGKQINPRNFMPA